MDEDHWLPAVRDKIQGCLELPADWDSYGGGPVDDGLAAAATTIAEYMGAIGFSRPDVCPQSSGGILFEWQESDKLLTIDLDGVAGFSFAYESSEKPELEGDIEDLVGLLGSGIRPF